MKTDNTRTEDLSALREEIERLKEENEHLKNFHHNVFSVHLNKESLNQFDFLNYALNNTTESIITITSKGDIIYLNDTTCKRLGYKRSELLNKNISLIDPTFGPDIWASYWEKLKKVKTFSFFSHQKTKDGTLVPVEITPTYLQYNGAEYCISFAKDLSDIKAAEEIISQTEMMLSTVLVNSSESIALSAVEGIDEYRLLYTNATNLKHINDQCNTNFTERDLVGRMHDDLFLNVYNCSQEELNFDNQKKREAIQSGNRIFYEERFRSGEEILHLESCVTPIFNEKNICTHVLWSARDITERKKAEEEKLILLNETLTLNEELKANEEELRQILDSTIELNAHSEQNELKLRAIFDSTQSINYLLDRAGNILWFNKPANENSMRRFNRGIELNKSIKNYMDAYLHEKFDVLFTQAMRGETVFNELKLNSSGGKRTWIQTTMMPVYKDQTELIGISMNVTDISERKKREEELKQINKELIYQNEQLNQYSYIVSHNLRGPIATILGITNVFESKQTTPELKDALIKHIQKSTYHLDTIIRDLNFILSNTKETDHTRTTVELETELSVIQDLYKLQIEKAEAEIDFNFSKAPTIFAIKSFIHSILSNLISNSLKYKKPNVRVLISIRSERKKNIVVITYVDNGLGIDMEQHRDKIFGFYKRFHTHVEGKGMGLHLIKTQVEMMGGRIEIASEVNKGTAFTITLKHQ
ncbi:MAG TPA: PAS domain S-box protein [Cytophagaceae bacterium]|nr:PAS domain S-box protein [Cytophagaceae bacterium]